MRSTLSVLSLLVFAACTDTEDTGKNVGNDDTGTVPAGEARVRVAHLSPDAPAVDVYVAGAVDPVVTGLGYGQVGEWLTVPEGTYGFDIRAAGADAASAPAYTTDSWTLPSGASATATAMGFLGSTDADDSFRVTAFVEGWGMDEAGSIRVRVVHAGADAPTVDLDVGADGTVDVPGFARFADTGAEGVLLPADADTRIGVWAGGSFVTSFTVPALPAGTEVLVYAAGLLSEPARVETGFVLVAATDDGVAAVVRQDPVVYALHASPDAPAVDVYAGDAEVISEFGFGAVAGPLQVPPGTYTFDLYGASAGDVRPDSSPAASFTTPPLAAGERYLAIATGFLGDGSFGLLPVVEGWDTADDDLARLVVVHASPDAPPVDVGTVTDGVLTPVISDLAFGETSDPAGLALPAGTYPIGLAAAGSTVPLLDTDVTVSAGQNIYAVAIGSLAGEGEAFEILAIDTSTTPWSSATLWP